MREGVDLGVLATVTVDSAKAGKGVLTVNVHGARSADTLTARTTESEGGVDLILNFDESIENLQTHITVSYP